MDTGKNRRGVLEGAYFKFLSQADLIGKHISPPLLHFFHTTFQVPMFPEPHVVKRMASLSRARYALSKF